MDEYFRGDHIAIEGPRSEACVVRIDRTFTTRNGERGCDVTSGCNSRGAIYMSELPKQKRLRVTCYECRQSSMYQKYLDGWANIESAIERQFNGP